MFHWIWALDLGIGIWGHWDWGIGIGIGGGKDLRVGTVVCSGWCVFSCDLEVGG